jgi:hypothetical protein
MLTLRHCSASIWETDPICTLLGGIEIVRFLTFAAVFYSLLLCSAARANDFPTQARVEYVFKCMNSHGGQRYEALYSCVCVIDKIAEKIAYDEYVEADVFTQLRSTPGERGGLFRDPDRAGLLVDKIFEITAGAEKSCFVGLSAKSAS